MREINNDNLVQIINENDCVVVDVFAKWCQPCKVLVPIIENTSKKMSNVDFCKIDVDENPEIANEYNIRSIPTLLFFKNGKHVQTHVGIIQENQLIEKINVIKNG